VEEEENGLSRYSYTVKKIDDDADCKWSTLSFFVECWLSKGLWSCRQSDNGKNN